MLKTLIVSTLLLISILTVQGQLTIQNGSSITFNQDAPLSIDGLTLTPSASYTLSGPLTIIKAGSSGQTTVNPSIQRVYQFSTASAPFTGTIRINYDDADLNGIQESMLELNVFKTNTWQQFTASQSDQSLNFVTTNISTATPITELTLAAQNAALPLYSLQFTSTRSGNDNILKGSVAGIANQGTYFNIYHRKENEGWKLLTTGLLISGSFSFTHVNTPTGNNYYQVKIIEPGRSELISKVLRIQNGSVADYFIIENPSLPGKIMINVGASQQFQLYSGDGKLIATKYFSNGIHQWNIVLKKGIYLLKGSINTSRLIVK